MLNVVWLFAVMLSVILHCMFRLKVILLNVIMLSVNMRIVITLDAESCSECHDAKSRDTECYFAGCLLSVALLSSVILSVVVLMVCAVVPK